EAAQVPSGAAGHVQQGGGGGVACPDVADQRPGALLLLGLVRPVAPLVEGVVHLGMTVDRREFAHVRSPLVKPAPGPRPGRAGPARRGGRSTAAGQGREPRYSAVSFSSVGTISFGLGIARTSVRS